MEKPKTEAPELQNGLKLIRFQLWTFTYKKGPAPKTGIVEAYDERMAMKIATHWSLLNGCRPPASVQPMILADESILQVKLGAEEEALPDPVAATTNELVAG